MLVDKLWSSPPANHLELLRSYDKQVRDAYARGDYEPVVWPYRTWGFLVVLIYLLLPPTSSKVIRYMRYPVFAYFVYWSIRCARETRSIHMHADYGIGLINVWSVIWLAALMIFTDARTEAQSIERRASETSEKQAQANGHTRDPIAASTSSTDVGGELRARFTKPQTSTTTPNQPERSQYSYYWQPLPSSLRARLLWVYHLTTSFRGAGWSFQTTSIPPPPPHIQHTLPPSPTPNPNLKPSHTPRTYPTRRSLLHHNTLLFLACYLIIDAWKTFALRDPYFWGYLSAPAPPQLPSLIRESPILTHSYRLIISLSGVWAALNFITSLNALVYCCLLTDAHPFLGVKGEAWMYPSFWGPLSVLWEEGLAGWWGRWWHQLFRVGFTAPAKWALRALGWEGRSRRGKVLGLVIAFGLSGCVHAAGSWTSWGASEPWKPFLFFVLQGLGVGVEAGVMGWCKARGLDKKVPSVVRKVLVGLWVVFVMYWTAELLVGDFAKSGIWLFEPIPVSPLRGMGFGLPEEGWWCWHGPMVWWHHGDTWYKSGIAL